MFRKIFDRLFLVKEISSKTGELHFQRWRFINTPWFALHLHKILRADQDRHCHSHPFDFISLILWGGYIEQYPDGSSRIFGPGSLNIKNAEQFHKVQHLLGKGHTYTLFLTGRRKEDWGYSVEGRYVGFVQYRNLKDQGLL